MNVKRKLQALVDAWPVSTWDCEEQAVMEVACREALARIEELENNFSVHSVQLTLEGEPLADVMRRIVREELRAHRKEPYDGGGQ